MKTRFSLVVLFVAAVCALAIGPLSAQDDVFRVAAVAPAPSMTSPSARACSMP